MRIHQVAFVAVMLLLVSTSPIEAKRRKHKNNDGDSRKTKTKTKWSSSTDIDAGSANTMIATEEHGYYVKRTYVPENATLASRHLRSPPYLAIPIAWFSCSGDACQNGNTGTINGNTNALQEGFLCDDDCVDSYAPVCGKTPREVAVFYNKCKLSVAKCRTHGLWTDYTYTECQLNYPKETEYADKKFRASPYFRESETTGQPNHANQDETQLLTENKSKDADNSKPVAERDLTTEDHLAVAMAALDEINAKLDEAGPSTSHDAAQAKNSKDRLKYDVGH